MPVERIVAEAKTDATISALRVEVSKRVADLRDSAASGCHVNRSVSSFRKRGLFGGAKFEPAAAELLSVIACVLVSIEWVGGVVSFRLVVCVVREPALTQAPT